MDVEEVEFVIKEERRTLSVVHRPQPSHDGERQGSSCGGELTKFNASSYSIDMATMEPRHGSLSTMRTPFFMTSTTRASHTERITQIISADKKATYLISRNHYIHRLMRGNIPKA